jgi:hypothetical protein
MLSVTFTPFMLNVVMLSVVAPADDCRKVGVYLHKRGLFYEPILAASLHPNIRLGQRCFSASQLVTKARYKLQQ